MRYEPAHDIEERIFEIALRLRLDHLDLPRIKCVRSYGSKSRQILARCHSMSKLMSQSLGIKPHYVIEVVSENFEKLDAEEATKTLIHELLHIPKSFGGGFKGHRYANRRSVDRLYSVLKSSSSREGASSGPL